MIRVGVEVGVVCMLLYDQIAARSAARRSGVLPPDEKLEPEPVDEFEGFEETERFGIGFQSVVMHVETDEQSNSIQPPFIPETYAQPVNCPWLLTVTPTGVPPETLEGEKLIHEPTLA